MAKIQISEAMAGRTTNGRMHDRGQHEDERLFHRIPNNPWGRTRSIAAITA